MALNEIDDKNVFIIPRDAGYNNPEKLAYAINDIKAQGVKIIIGPISYKEFSEVKKYNDLTFISPSNVSSISLISLFQLSCICSGVKVIIVSPKKSYGFELWCLF